MPPRWVSLSHAAWLFAWGAWSIARSEPERLPYGQAEQPGECLAALAPLWAWGWAAVGLAAWRAASVRSLCGVRWSALAEAVLFTLAGTLIVFCAPVPGALFYLYMAHEAGWSVLLASRKVGENGVH